MEKQGAVFRLGKEGALTKRFRIFSESCFSGGPALEHPEFRSRKKGKHKHPGMFRE